MPAKTKNDNETKPKDEVETPAEVTDFTKEKPGTYSHEHILLKLRRIRDNSLDVVDECASSRKWKGMGAAEQAFEMAMNNIERQEARRDGTPGAGNAIRIEIPGFDPSQISFNKPAPKDAAEKP
jgi:hypothetical protein